MSKVSLGLTRLRGKATNEYSLCEMTSKRMFNVEESMDIALTTHQSFGSGYQSFETARHPSLSSEGLRPPTQRFRDALGYCVLIQYLVHRR